MTVYALATLTYAVNPTRLTAAALVPLIDSGAAPIPADTVDLIGGAVAGDVTAVVGTQAVRTITWVFDAKFRGQFPDGTDQASPFRNLLTQIIERSVRHPVVSSVVLGLAP